MNAPERNLLKDTVLNVGLLAVPVVWVLLAALQNLLAVDVGPDSRASTVVSSPAAAAGLAVTPAKSGAHDPSADLTV